MATPKQEKLLKLILDNMGSKGLTKTMGELLKEAGYSESIQKNPYLIMEGEAIVNGLSDVVGDLEELRSKALNELKGRDLTKENYKDVVKATDTFTKNHQLLTGGDTERNTQPLLVKIIGDEQSDGDTN